jgi:hypothetical protein
MRSRARLMRHALLTQTMSACSLLLVLLLPLVLGGCWEQTTRPRAAELTSAGSYGRSALPGDDIPTPRLFQINLSHGQSE